MINEISVFFTTDEKIQELNSEYRKKDKPTDVLSFSQIEGEGPPQSSFLGDIVISLDTTIQQAEAMEVSPEEELLRLLLHGTLHLFGYEHEGVPEKTAEEMFSLQERLLHTYEKELSRAKLFATPC